MSKVVRTLCVLALGTIGALAAASAAAAHAHVSPPIVQAKESQEFALDVPTEKENASTTTVEFTPPAGLLDRLLRPVTRLEAGRAVDWHG